MSEWYTLGELEGTTKRYIATFLLILPAILALNGKMFGITTKLGTLAGYNITGGLVLSLMLAYVMFLLLKKPYQI